MSDCWTVVDGLVYDITKYIRIHPGGKKIMRGAGKDSTDLFIKFHKGVDINSTPVTKLVIGKFDPNKTLENSQDEEPYVPDKSLGDFLIFGI
mmetsp:Transcript_17084/g.12143  ORF Transcript_17084/g.12143 Transcript_17084/m.12143 type:complete len:92 (-) Transcript_17084:32-307(-)